MKNTVAVIPVKLNNERCPGKNIKCFDNGRPLISYILDTIKKVEGIEEIYVYCSNPEIKRYLPEGVQYLKRKEYLDLSITSILAVLQEFAKDVPAENYVLVHATAPFIKASSIQRGVEAVVSGEYDSALTVTKMQEFLWRDGKPWNYDVTIIPRTQDLEPLYTETTGMYIYKRELVLNKNRRVGDNPYLVEVSKIEAIDINDPIDFVIANACRDAAEEE